MRSGTEPFWSSSHISAIDSLQPPPQSSTLSPKGSCNIQYLTICSYSTTDDFVFTCNMFTVEKFNKLLSLPINLTFHTLWGSIRESDPNADIFVHTCPNTDFIPSGPARPPLLRDLLTCIQQYSSYNMLQETRRLLQFQTLLTRCLHDIEKNQFLNFVCYILVIVAGYYDK